MTSFDLIQLKAPAVLPAPCDQMTTRDRLQALLESTEAPEALDNEAAVRAVALFDHEEVGSASAIGAGGPLMRDTIVRVSRAFAGGAADATERCLQRSFLVSADMAHALHPNYSDKHEPDHQPKFNKCASCVTSAVTCSPRSSCCSHATLRWCMRPQTMPQQDKYVFTWSLASPLWQVPHSLMMLSPCSRFPLEREARW